jgi:zinc finger protein 830
MEEGPAALSGHDADDEERQTKRSKVDGLKTSGQAAPAPTIVDDELDSFLSSIAGIAADPDPSSASGSIPKPVTKKAYKPSQPEAQTLYEAAPTLFVPDNGSTITAAPTSASNPFAGRLTAQTEGPVLPDAVVVEPEEEEETEAERHARAQREEREEIIDRLEEETRAQWVSRFKEQKREAEITIIREDADDRVQTLKAKLEAVKRQRRERLAKKQQW